jgi:DnaA-like protein
MIESYCSLVHVSHSLGRVLAPPEDVPHHNPLGEGPTTESAWNMTLKKLKEQVPEDTYETRLKDTALLQITNRAARIAVPSTVKTRPAL